MRCAPNGPAAGAGPQRYAIGDRPPARRAGPSACPGPARIAGVLSWAARGAVRRSVLGCPGVPGRVALSARPACRLGPCGPESVAVPARLRGRPECRARAWSWPAWAGRAVIGLPVCPEGCSPAAPRSGLALALMGALDPLGVMGAHNLRGLAGAIFCGRAAGFMPAVLGPASLSRGVCFAAAVARAVGRSGPSGCPATGRPLRPAVRCPSAPPAARVPAGEGRSGAVDVSAAAAGSAQVDAGDERGPTDGDAAVGAVGRHPEADVKALVRGGGPFPETGPPPGR